MLFIKEILLGVLLASAPVLNSDQLKQEGVNLCPDGTVITVRVYDPDPEDARALLVEFLRGNIQVGVLDRKANELYVTLTDKIYNLDDPKLPYESACDLPQGTKT